MKLNTFNFVCFVIFLISAVGSNTVYAQQFDQSYLKWKAEQEKADAQLKGNDPNYYLSKPNISKSSGSKSGLNSAKAKTSRSMQAQGALSSNDKVHLNSANLTELQQLNGVGEKKAQMIIEYRDQHGKFKSIAELENVKGIGPKLVEKNRSRLSL